MPDGARPASEHTIETKTHGRYLHSAGAATGAPVLVGFHGYGETAEDELGRLRAIPGIDDWTVVSVEGLHKFYRRRTDEIVASWMTRQNRQLAIADNIAYVSNVVSRVSEGAVTLVLTGFSQGVAMAFRAAAALSQPVAGVIACGGDIPPELEAKALARIPAVLLGRGARDEWYLEQKLASDEHRLRAAGVAVQAVILDAAHDWTPEFADVCSKFLQTLLQRDSPPRS